MTSVRYSMWDDTGYTESGLERPPIGAPLSSPDHVFTDERPNRDDLFSKVSVKGDYVELMNVSYLMAEYDFNESSPITVYGWVDGVALRSDSSGYPMTDIYWHPDLWRTYASKAEFRAGTVRRRPADANIPPQGYPLKYREASYAGHDFCGDVVDNSDLWWCCVNYVRDGDASAHDTYIATTCFPVIRPRSASPILLRYIRTPNLVQVCPTLDDLMVGLLEERMEIDPQSIIGVSMSPLAPCAYTGTGTQADPFVLDQSRGWIGVLNGDSTYAWFRNFGAFREGMYEVYNGTLPEAVMTDDVRSYAIQTLDGTLAGTLPWGMRVKDYTIRLVNMISSFYIQIRFNGIMSAPEGLTVTIPLPMVSVTSNSWSSYVYSGQRQYDIDTRRMQTMQDIVGGLTGGLTTGINAWQMESLANFGRMKNITYRNVYDELVPNIPNIKYNASLGRRAAITGAVAGGSVIGAGVLQGAAGVLFNDEYQRFTDYAAAHQTDNVLMPGDGFDYIFNGCRIRLMVLDIDTYSYEQRAQDISMYGAHVTEPKTSCQALVMAGGPLQITNMTVGGDIPVEAKEYIRAMFSNGVRLV